MNSHFGYLTDSLTVFGTKWPHCVDMPQNSIPSSLKQPNLNGNCVFKTFCT